MSTLTAIITVCTLTPSPADSSSDLLAQHIRQELSKHGVSSEILRIVDHNVLPGIGADMGDGDAWPTIRDKILEADIFVMTTPIWLGHPASIAQRVLERLNSESSTTDQQERPVMFDKPAMIGVVGNEDGAHNVIAQLAQGLSDIGFTIPAQGSTYWVGEAMHTTDYQDLDQTPKATADTTKVAARNTAHLAKLLKNDGYPAE